MARTLGYPLLFDSSSVAFVNANKNARVMNEPDNPRYIPANLRGAQAPLRRPGRGRQVAAVLVFQTRTVVDFRCP